MDAEIIVLSGQTVYQQTHAAVIQHCFGGCMDVHVIVYRAANQDAVSWVESHLKNLLVRRDAKEMRILLVGTHADMMSSGSAPPLHLPTLKSRFPQVRRYCGFCDRLYFFLNSHGSAVNRR